MVTGEAVLCDTCGGRAISRRRNSQWKHVQSLGIRVFALFDWHSSRENPMVRRARGPFLRKHGAAYKCQIEKEGDGASHTDG